MGRGDRLRTDRVACDWKRNNQPGAVAFRYLAIRVRSLQADLFEEDDASWRHFSVVTNMDWRGDRLLRWHREKQGTVEHGHGVLKNDLGGGVLPTGKFGAKRMAAPSRGGGFRCWWPTCWSC